MLIVIKRNDDSQSFYQQDSNAVSAQLNAYIVLVVRRRKIMINNTIIKHIVMTEWCQECELKDSSHILNTFQALLLET